MLDINVWNEWNYRKNLCVMGSLSEKKTFKPYICKQCGKPNYVEKEVKRRHYLIKKKIDEVGLPPILAPLQQK